MMAENNIAAPPAPGPATERFLECLREVEKVSQTLQQALFKRKPDIIWQAIEEQEQSMRKFTACYQDYIRAREEAAGIKTSSDSLIQDLIKRIKSIHRSNKAIAHAFLDVIDRTITGLSGLQGGNPFVYDANGRIGQMTPPLLVQERG